MPIFIFLFLSSFLTLSVGEAKTFEERIHEIYKSKEMQPVSNEDWLIFGRQVSKDSYTIRKGDTLWGLSKVFFGNGLYWSKIWSLNGGITNPHLIYPGAVIEFFPGSATNAPGLKVQDQRPQLSKADNNKKIKSDTPNKNEPEVVEDVVETFPDAPVIPPPHYIAAPVRSLPSSFKGSNLLIDTYGKDGIRFDVKPQDVKEGSYFPSSYISEVDLARLSPIGEVIEIEFGQQSAGYGTMIYLETSDELAKGESLLVLRQGDRVSGKGGRGRLIEIAGSLEITEAINSEKYRAIVTGAFFPISKKAALFRKSLPKVSPSGGRARSERFSIFGGEAWNGRKLMGRGEIVFVTGGRSDGLAVGDLFGIYKNRVKRYSSSSILKTPIPTAKIKIFDVQENISSAVVISSFEDVQIGDFTGKPEISISGISEKERADLDEMEASLDPEGFTEEAGETLSEEEIQVLDSEEDSSDDEEFLDSEDSL